MRIEYLKENLNKAVFTTKKIIEKGVLIKYVAHDDEDDWQFFEEEFVSTSDIMIVSLEQIVKIDTTLVDTMKLPIGGKLIRSGVEEEWELVID
ncbi:MAG: hypothetical protein COB15_08575 [Flavobacteriales bacterium]|nr:MAG: hypothetical protein COB15_08575 [Flavobacteriales bacterium]